MLLVDVRSSAHEILLSDMVPCLTIIFMMGELEKTSAVSEWTGDTKRAFIPQEPTRRVNFAKENSSDL